ncbi:PHP domain-containing protein [Schlesneria paludicola]|uniref:PHP domain-containing protein n=1 Tax=Schlesneria paludicola TaxID=360056 RepID=UPI00029A8435|nr:PHP domain-containing protein [Schlesneria paludicola]
MRYVNFNLGLLFAFCLVTQAHAIDAIDRLTAERLEAVHQSIMTFKTERRDIPRRGPYQEYRANLHVHSAFSHDSRGKIEDIVAAAKAAGTSVLMFTEHPAKHYDVFIDGHQGLRDEVLLIPGAETNGMLVYPRQSIKDMLSAKPQDLSDFVRGREGLTFVSHLEERMDWQLSGVTGVEIYNTHADSKDEKRLMSSLRNPLWLLKSADLFQRYPQEAFSALFDYPADYLKRWDQLCEIAPHTGVSANDAHQNIGITVRMAEDDKVRVEDGLGEEVLTLEAAVFAALKPIPKDTKPGTSLFELRLDTYERSLRHVGTHLLLRELTQPAVWEALNQGRAFVAFDWIADATGFDYAATSADVRTEMGGNTKIVAGLTLSGRAPLAGHWRLIRNGQIVQEYDGSNFELTVREPGVYRSELWLKVGGEDRPWVLSNPIYITEK